MFSSRMVNPPASRWPPKASSLLEQRSSAFFTFTIPADRTDPLPVPFRTAINAAGRL